MANEDSAFAFDSALAFAVDTDFDSASGGSLGGLGYGLSASLLGQTAEQSEIDQLRRRIEAIERQSSGNDDGNPDDRESGEDDATGTNWRTA